VLQRHSGVTRATVAFLSILGYALTGSVVFAHVGLPMLSAAAALTVLLGGCEADGVSRATARSVADVLGPTVEICRWVPGANILVPVLGPLLGVMSAVADARPVAAADLVALAAGAASADGRVSPELSRQWADRVASVIRLDISAWRTGPASTPTPRSTVRTPLIDYPTALTPIASPAEYATAYARALAESVSLAPSTTDWQPMIRAQTLVDRRRARLHSIRQGATADSRARLARADTYLDMLQGNGSPRPWSPAIALAVINDPLGRHTAGSVPLLPLLPPPPRLTIVAPVFGGGGDGGGGGGIGVILAAAAAAAVLLK